MKPLHLVMGISLLVSAWLALSGDKAPQEGVATVPSRMQGESRPKQAGDPRARQGSGDQLHTGILALKPRAELIGDEAITAKGDLFGRQTWVAPIVSSSFKPLPLPTTSTMPAVPAAVPSLTYVGKKQEDGIWEVYLSQQDQLFIVKEKTVIDGKYRVESIAPPQLILTYLPSSQKQTVMIGAIE